MKKTKGILILLLLSISLYGQKKVSGIEFYATTNIGVTQYYGDLNTHFYYNTIIPLAYGLVVGYQINPMIGIRGQYMMGVIKGANNQYSFTSDLWDVTLCPTISLSNLVTANIKQRMIDTYFFGGVGIARFDSRLYDIKGTLINEYEQNQEYIAVIGVGLTCAVLPLLDVNLEYGNRYLFVDDKLDLYPSLGLNDHYGYYSFGVTFKFWRSAKRLSMLNF